MKFFASVLAIGLFTTATLTNAEPEWTAKTKAAELRKHRFLNECEAGLTAFTNTTYAFIRESNKCVLCHSGNIPAPAFAVADVKESYRRVRNYVNFADINGSYFVKRAGNGHCGTCGVTEQQMIDSVTAWWNGGEKDCPQTGQFVSASINLPENTPEDPNGFTTISWDLGSISNIFKNSSLQMEAQIFSKPDVAHPGAYRFRKPKIINSKLNVRIKDLKVLVNNQHDLLADAYTTVNTTVSPQAVQGGDALPYPILSAESLIVIQNKAQDFLSISFNTLESVAEPLNCNDMDYFNANIYPLTEKRACYYCHGGQGEEGFAPDNQVFNMDLTPEQLCSAMLQRSSSYFPLFSAIIKMPMGQGLGHPKIFTSRKEVEPTWTEWIKQEWDKINARP